MINTRTVYVVRWQIVAEGIWTTINREFVAHSEAERYARHIRRGQEGMDPKGRPVEREFIIVRVQITELDVTKVD